MATTPTAARPLLAGLVLAATALCGAQPAAAQDPGAALAVDGTLAADGSLAVQQTITFGSGGGPARLEQRIATTEETVDRAHYVFAIRDVSASQSGRRLAPSITTRDGQSTIVVELADRSRPVQLSYTVDGAARPAEPVDGEPSRTEVRWALVQGLNIPLRSVEGRLSTPGQVGYVDCESGPRGRLSPCGTFSAGTHDSPQPSFTDGPRAAGEVVELDVALPGDVVAPNARLEQRWSLDRAFSVTRATVLASLLPLLLGGALLWLLHRRTGRDVVGAPVAPVAEFTPVGPGASRFTVLQDVRPGHVGTVADERVDPIDVTATILDLAVRGWLRIVELPREGAHRQLDWTFERVADGQGELRPFEAHLRDAIAPGDGHPAARVSMITGAIAPVVEQVQHELYQDVVERGWFERSPHQTRGRWALLGWAALAAAIATTLALVAFTRFGLVGFALTALALGALLVAQEMPRRTSQGTALLAGLSALASQLQTQSTAQLPPGEEYQELSRILPYAVVLGGRERWLQALVAADKDDAPDGEDLDWYRAGDDWHLRDLPESLDAFIVMVQGKLFGR